MPHHHHRPGLDFQILALTAFRTLPPTPPGQGQQVIGFQPTQRSGCQLTRGPASVHLTFLGLGAWPPRGPASQPHLPRTPPLTMNVALSPERTAGPEDSSTSGVRSGGEERALPSCSHELPRSPSSFSRLAGSTVRSPGARQGRVEEGPCVGSAPQRDPNSPPLLPDQSPR